MKSSIISLLSFVALTVVSTTALAEPYVGFGIGSASYKADLSALGGGELDDNGTATKLYGGYTFNKYFSLEASVYNFAEASVGALENSSGGFDSAAVSVKGVGAYAVGMYPVTKNFSLIAKLGLLNWDADLRVNDISGTNDGNDAAYALAASYAFTKELLVVGEWESFNTDNPELSMLSLGFRFNFN